MKKALLGTVLLGGLIAEAPTLFAQTYEYVDMAGNIKVEAANTPTEAMNTALNIAPTSGVAAVSHAVAATVAPIDMNTEVYTYVRANGELAIQPAESPEEALNLAVDKAATSGVMLTVE